MKLVIGGAYQGKREAACRLFGYAPADFLDGRSCALSAIADCRAVAYFHEYIRRCMRQNWDILCADDMQGPRVSDAQGSGANGVRRSCADDAQGPDENGAQRPDAGTFAAWLIRVNPGILIVTDEIGYGVVPLAQEERAWRETTGRVCCRLAEYSDTVVRVLAGIPTVIKRAGASGEAI